MTCIEWKVPLCPVIYFQLLNMMCAELMKPIKTYLDSFPHYTARKDVARDSKQIENDFYMRCYETVTICISISVCSQPCLHDCHGLTASV